MITKILKHFRSFIVMLMLLSVLIWFFSFKTFPKESSPAINVPFFTLSVIYPWADSNTVEKQVVEKLESNLASISGIKSIDSISAYNVWVVSVEFARDKNISEAYNDINSAIDKTKVNFPSDVKEVIVKRVDVTESPIYTFSVVWPYLPSVLYDRINWLEDNLKTISGVSEVTVIWSYTPWIKIKFDYQKLWKNNINFSYAINQVQTYLDKFPADKKELDWVLYTFSLRTYPKEFDNMTDFLDNLNIINNNWNSILLKDIAKITSWPFMAKKESYVMDSWKTYSSVTYSIKKVPWTDILNTIELIKLEIKKNWLTFSDSNFIPELNFIEKFFEPKSITLDEVKKKELSNLKVYEIMSQKEKIDWTYKTFISNFRQTTIIIFIIILFFIWFKESIWITIAFPLVFLISFIVLKNIGYTFNNIVSFSLILTLWIMVDNLIVIIEWFEEWLKKWLKKWDAIAFSIKTYNKPIISWNLTTISMFFPIWFMLSGKMWDFMKYMPVTIDVVLLISIFVSLVFLPIILSFLNFDKVIKRIEKEKRENKPSENKLFKKLESFFKFTIKNYKKSIFSFILLFIFTIWLASQFLKADFLPLTDTNNIYINVKFEPWTTFNENKEIMSKISSNINKYSEENKGLIAYQAINIWDYKSLNPLDNVIYWSSFNSDLSYIDLRLTDKDNERNYDSYSIVTDLKWRIKKKDISNKIVSIETFIIKSWPSWWKDIWFSLVWEKLEDIVEFYNEIKAELESIEWTYDWSHSLEYTKWKMEIQWDIKKLKEFNITPKELDIFIASIENSENYEPNWIPISSLDDFSSELIDVKAFTKIDSWTNILDLMLPWRSIYLNQLVKGSSIKGEIKSIIHGNNRLVLSIWAYKTKKTSMWDVTPIIENAIEKAKLKISWVSLEYAWDIKDMQNSMKDLMSAFGIGIILMLTVLVLHFWNFKQPFLVLSVIPFLFIGAIFLLIIAWLPFSFPAQLWMFWLMWVWVNDAILLIERFNDEKKKYLNNISLKEENELILEVVRSRFKPVLLTTITTVMWLATLAIKDDLWGSLAMAFIGWLLLWTLIILVYIPAMLKWWMVKKRK